MPAKAGIQYAENSRSITDVSGILGRPVKPGDDTVGAETAYFCGWAGAAAEPPVGAAASAVFGDLPGCCCASPSTAGLTKPSCGLGRFGPAPRTQPMSCRKPSGALTVRGRLGRCHS